eukprot:6062292-Prymnesium_polylepis.2
MKQARPRRLRPCPRNLDGHRAGGPGRSQEAHPRVSWRQAKLVLGGDRDRTDAVRAAAVFGRVAALATDARVVQVHLAQQPLHIATRRRPRTVAAGCRASDHLLVRRPRAPGGHRPPPYGVGPAVDDEVEAATACVLESADRGPAPREPQELQHEPLGVVSLGGVAAGRAARRPGSRAVCAQRIPSPQLIPKVRAASVHDDRVSHHGRQPRRRERPTDGVTRREVSVEVGARRALCRVRQLEMDEQPRPGPVARERSQQIVVQCRQHESGREGARSSSDAEGGARRRALARGAGGLCVHKISRRPRPRRGGRHVRRRTSRRAKLQHF